MKKRAVFLALLCLMLAAPARAEILDDDSIRGLYAAYIAALKSSDDHVSFMQARFEDKYTREETYTRITGDSQPQTGSDTTGKDLEVLNAIRAANELHITDAQGSVVKIAYSDDHKYAYVTYTLVLTGTTKIQAPDGSSAAAGYGDAEGCIDQLALVKDTIMIVKSACNGKITIGQ